MDRAPSAEQLLSDATWLRRLAQSLAGEADADDLVQETWIAALRRRPDASRSLRPWLFKGMRDGFRMRRRASHRRAARKSAVAEPNATASPDELLDQVRLHRLIAELVLALDEPFRSTLLLRYVDGQTSSAIARQTGVSEGTVRWRVHEALRRLRQQLDAQHGGRNRWVVAAFVHPPATVANTAALWAWLALALVVVIGSLLLVSRTNGPAREGAPAADVTVVSRAAPNAAIATRSAEDAPTRHARAWWDVEGVQLHEIRGRVVTREGRPIVGARVELWGWSHVTSGTAEAHRTTSADGTFSFRPGGAAMYNVTASAPGRAPRAVRVDPRAPLGEVVPGDVSLVLDDCSATVEGTVDDSGGGPIAGATVRWGLGMMAFSGTTLTDEQGRYVGCLSEDAVSLTIGADGYEHVRLPLSPRGKQRIDVVLAPAGRIRGRLVEERTGTPVVSAQVFVAGASPGTTVEPRHTISGGDGMFELDGLRAGRVVLHVWSADHFMFDSRELSVTAGETLDAGVISLSPAATVRGKVVSEGAPLAGMSVALSLPTSRGMVESLRAVTGDDGSFVAIGVGIGSTLAVRVRGAVVRSPVTLDTTSGDVSDVVIEVDTPVVVRGDVLRAGRPVAAARVRVQTASGRSTVVDTDAQGRFHAAAPDAGPCFVSATSERLGASTAGEVSLPCDTSKIDVSLVLDAGSTVSGTVTDGSGVPIPGMFVNARASSGESRTARTDTDGKFTITQLAGGREYVLTVADYDGGPALPWVRDDAATVHLLDGDAHQAGLVLAVVHRREAIRGRVVDDTGMPVPDAVIRATIDRASNAVAARVPHVRSDERGAFTLRVTGDGPFQVEAGIGDQMRAALRGVKPGATDVVLQLVGVAGLRGSLTDLDGASVAVRAIDLGVARDPHRTAMANVEGREFELHGLLPGTYEVRATGRDGRTGATTVDLVSGQVTDVRLAAGQR